MIDDAELLRRYADEKSEAAFAELVQRRIGFVYSVALRHTRDVRRAEDVAQRVFTDLARKAPALARRPVLLGWLHRSAQFAASDVLRAERRRQIREAEAHTMQQIERDGIEPDWEQLRPTLDELLNAMPERDRDVVLMRFFEGRTFPEIGARLQVGENAVRMRVERALEKMRLRLARRGVSSTAAAVGAALANQGALAAPVGLAAHVTGVALASAGSASGAAWLIFLTMNKVKTGIVAAVLLAAWVPALVQVQARQAMNAEIAELRADGKAAQEENSQLLATLTKVGATSQAPNETEDLVRLRTRAAQLRARPEGVVDAEMRPPSNAGCGTPEAAFETLNWAAVTGDWEVLATTWEFRGETKAKADAFFAGLNSAAQKKFGTAERALAYAIVSTSQPSPLGGAWMTAMQVYDTQMTDGPAPARVRIWQRQGTGREMGNEATFERGGNGHWVTSNIGVGQILEKLSPLLDPQTGEPKSKQK